MSTIIDRLEGPPDKKAVEEVEAKECSICGIAYVSLETMLGRLIGAGVVICNTSHVITVFRLFMRAKNK